MNLSDILFPALLIGGLGIILGLALSFAGELFRVELDPVTAKIRSALPGANCGGCGYVGCDALASAIAKGGAPVTACPVGGFSCAAAIGEILGVEADENARLTAFVKCTGGYSVTVNRYEYDGMEDCRAAAALGGGPKQCPYGCLGFGNCVKACRFGALKVEGGVAVVDWDKCTACGKCAAECPKGLFELASHSAPVIVACNSCDVGKVVRSGCKVGCIACKLCEKACKFDAAHVVDGVCKIDQEKCTGCRECVSACPSKCIITSGTGV